MMSGQLPGSSSGAVPSSLHSALQMNPQPPPHMNVKQPSPNQEIPSPSSVTAGTKRRRKNDIGDGEGQSGPSEPRRLRRSHEACARCRGKKIKASPAGRHRHGKFQENRMQDLSFRLLVRLKTSSMHGLPDCWRRMQPGRPTSSDSHSPRIHRTCRAPACPMRGFIEAPSARFRNGQYRGFSRSGWHRNFG